MIFGSIKILHRKLKFFILIILNNLTICNPHNQYTSEMKSCKQQNYNYKKLINMKRFCDCDFVVLDIYCRNDSFIININ